MNPNWVDFGMRLIPLITLAVNAVESISKNVAETKNVEMKGQEKQDAAMVALTGMINSIELNAGTELMAKEEFKELIRHIINDYVSIQNYIAQYQIQKENNLNK
jgi:hypothetical protein